jgi:hypothetical protein
MCYIARYISYGTAQGDAGQEKTKYAFFIEVLNILRLY